MLLQFVEATLLQIDFFNLLWGSDPHFWLFGRNYRKSYRKPIYRHFSNYRQNYRYRYEIFKFIGDLKELSAKLPLSKLTGDLSKNYQKTDLSPTPSPTRTPRDLGPLWHLIRVMSSHDLTDKKTMTKTNTMRLYQVVSFGPRTTLEIIGWGSPLDNFIVKLQTLSPGRRHWTISPARQRRLLSPRQSC